MPKNKKKSAENKKNVVFGIAFSSAGLLLWVILLWSVLLPGLDATTWSQTTCEILDAWVETHSGEDSDTYSINTRYQFRFRNQNVIGNKYSFDTSSSGYSRKRDIVERLIAEKHVPCWFNPEDTSKSVIVRTLDWEFTYPYFAMLFVFSGIAATGLWNR